MTKITTRAKIGANVIALSTALLIGGGVAYLVLGDAVSSLKSPHLMGQSNIKKPEAHTQKGKKTERERKEQALRPLPKQHADQMAQKAEQKSELQLKVELQRFEQMAEKLRQASNQALNKVERRKLPTGAPRDANDVSGARKIAKAGTTPLSANAGVAEMYERLREFEHEMQQRNIAITAAKKSLSEGLSFPEVYASLKPGNSSMPAYGDLLKDEFGNEFDTKSGVNLSSTDDLNKYRGLLDNASRQAGLARARLEGLFGGGRSISVGGGNSGGASNGTGSNGGGNGNSGNGGGNGDKGGGPGGNGQGNGGSSLGLGKDGKTAPYAEYAGPRLNPEMVKAQALPGRRFSKNASRKGWLYVNTWYMIGPWESYGRDDFALTHPPEVSVDFDATYTDGKVGVGVAETDSDPLQVIGPQVKLNGVLKWRFMQSESMHNTMPVTTGNATYYAYTELYFDEAASMLVAMGTDDSGRIWINGKEVWQDRGTSWYNIDEHIVTFNFRAGWNKVLVRLENGGGGPAGFSFLICPKNAVRL